MMSDPVWLTRTVSLQDRFGDNGLISVLLAKMEGDALVIDSWLMSCRVLKRGVEQFLLNHLVGYAKPNGFTRLIGEYIPSAKNGLVCDHYASLGFRQVGGEDSGLTRWELVIDDEWQPCQHFIGENPIDGPSHG